MPRTGPPSTSTVDASHMSDQPVSRQEFADLVSEVARLRSGLDASVEGIGARIDALAGHLDRHDILSAIGRQLDTLMGQLNTLSFGVVAGLSALDGRFDVLLNALTESPAEVDRPVEQPEV